MTIEKKKDGTSLTIILKGRLDTLAAPAFEEEVKKALPDLTELVFDLSELEYVSSSGLRVFLMAQKTMKDQGNMTVKNVSSSIYDIMEVTGFTNFLNIEQFLLIIEATYNQLDFLRCLYERKGDKVKANNE